MLNFLTPLFRVIDKSLPLSPPSLIAVARKRYACFLLSS
jgi:hypothetical protein